MSNYTEGLYSEAVRRYTPVDAIPKDLDTYVPQDENDFHFLMRCNSHFKKPSEGWVFNHPTASLFHSQFMGERTAMFGPNSADMFFTPAKIPAGPFIPSFCHPEVTSAIRKYREEDENIAAEIAYIFGGIVRYYSYKSLPEISNAVRFAARMTRLGDYTSGRAIAMAMSMYILSNGSLEKEKGLEGSVYKMAEAVSQDPVDVMSTDQLGLSQVSRLHTFLDSEPLPVEEVEKAKILLYGFPTVGAEFHLPGNAFEKYPTLRKRLAVLNMSQYQPGSYIQFCRDDRGVVEVRMNPSLYPVSIANWQYLKRILPELKNTYFTITLNSGKGGRNFYWNNPQDIQAINRLKALGMLCYAGEFDDVPNQAKSEEINFGSIYLGQTVRFFEGICSFQGNWGGGEGEHGQLGIYTGYGDSFPNLAYYLSMAFVNPNLMRSVGLENLTNINTLNDALALSQRQRRYLFMTMQNRIDSDEWLSAADKAGNRIIELLTPYLS